MTAIPAETPVDQNTLAEWYKAKAELDKWKAKEMLLRQLIFRHYFPNAKEGTSTVVLPDTYRLKGVQPVNRKVIEEAAQALLMRPQIGVADNGQPVFGPSKLEQNGISPDAILKWKPELTLPYYRTLTAEQQHLVDQMLLIDNGSPQLSIEPPAKPRGKAATTQENT